MQPYQKAVRAEIEHQNVPNKALKYAAPIAAASLAKRVIPFLSKFISPEMEEKGLSKIDPRMGKAMGHAFDLGYSQEDINEHIKNMVQGAHSTESNKQEPVKENRNIIEQYAPELHQFISDEIKQGRTPIEAAAMATLDKTGRKSFKNIIKKLTQDHKTPWSQIVESIYGSGQTAQPNQSNQQPAPTQQMQPQAQPMPSQAQPGQGQQALMSILQQINQKIGKA